MTPDKIRDTLRSGDYIEFTSSSGRRALISANYLFDGRGTIKAEWIDDGATAQDYIELEKITTKVMACAGIVSGPMCRFNSKDERDILHRRLSGGAQG